MISPCSCLMLPDIIRRRSLILSFRGVLRVLPRPPELENSAGSDAEEQEKIIRGAAARPRGYRTIQKALRSGSTTGPLRHDQESIIPDNPRSLILTLLSEKIGSRFPAVPHG